MWKFIVDVVHDFVSSLQPDVGRGFLHVSNVFLLTDFTIIFFAIHSIPGDNFCVKAVYEFIFL